MYEMSIIIPHYNTPILLEKLLCSIGIHEDVQVIVVDDNSNKDVEILRKIISNYQQDEYIFLDNKTNRKGAGVCRNIGMDYASGKWLLFADSDDYFMDGWYSEVKEKLSSDSDIIFFSPISRRGNKIARRHITCEKIVSDYVRRGDKDDELMLRTKFTVPWSKMIRRQLVSDYDIQFSETLYSNDDLFSTMIGIKADKIEASLNVIYCVREREGSLTKNQEFNAIYIRQEVFCEVYNYLKENLAQECFYRTYVVYVPITSLVELCFNHYKLSEIVSVIKLYRKYGVPVMSGKVLIALCKKIFEKSQYLLNKNCKQVSRKYIG